jgi:2-amino-4-hydroxy-6-hydroxymethyldihydropteridine diphosphokinase
MAIAYIGLGANIPGPAGPPEATLAAAAERLAQLGSIVACSSLYSTAPVGFADQPRFFNAVIALETGLAPRELLEELLDLELDFGRDRSAALRNGPRTLDLDILLYGDLVLSEHNLVVPHPRLAERAFVLVPLHEIAPDLRDPRTASTVGQLLGSLFPDPAEGKAHAVEKVESGFWPAGLCGGGSGHA